MALRAAGINSAPFPIQLPRLLWSQVNPWKSQHLRGYENWWLQRLLKKALRNKAGEKLHPLTGDYFPPLASTFYKSLMRCFTYVDHRSTHPFSSFLAILIVQVLLANPMSAKHQNRLSLKSWNFDCSTWSISFLFIESRPHSQKSKSISTSLKWSPRFSNDDPTRSRRKLSSLPYSASPG